MRSSIARRLGMDIGALAPVDRHVEGVVEMMPDATQNYRAPLTEERLFDWHAALFPAGRSGMARITVGAWRTGEAGPMQVVSGPIGREHVHFEAPGAERLPAEMQAFLAWFNAPSSTDPVLFAAVDYLWFVTIHPFEDGNGRIVRAIADMALARSEGSPQRFYSMSAQIRIERKTYYETLEQTQKGDLDIKAWLAWFLECLDRVFHGAEAVLATVLRKARFLAAHARSALNARQRLVVNRLLNGFEGKLTSSKYATLAKCSQDTAARDVEELCSKGILARIRRAGGAPATASSPAPPTLSMRWRVGFWHTPTRQLGMVRDRPVSRRTGLGWSAFRQLVVSFRRSLARPMRRRAMQTLKQGCARSTIWGFSRMSD
ncbi:Fic family protein [Xanthobacter oligotrophicus]|uniref:Fic family protein n=1 Tax=Xanthobacter oligotrophicus TaxID=2607286 RepID=A0ABW7A2R3_9HYPH